MCVMRVSLGGQEPRVQFTAKTDFQELHKHQVIRVNKTTMKRQAASFESMKSPHSHMEMNE